jgi:hypothetical protein
VAGHRRERLKLRGGHRACRIVSRAAPLGRSRVAGFGEPVADLLAGALRAQPQQLTCRRQLESPARALEEPRAAGRLEPAQDLAHGRLRQVHRFRRRAHAAAAGQFQKHAELAQAGRQPRHGDGLAAMDP